MKKLYILCLTAIAMITFNQNSRAAMVMIEVEDFEFDPAIFTVNVGDTIMWIWDEGFHTTTSTNIPAGANSWDAPVTSTSPVYMYVPTVAGSYDYQCTFHIAMNMLGHFTVSGVTGLAASSSNALTFNHSFTTNGQLNIAYQLTSPGLLQIKLYDMLGNVAKTIDTAPQTPGRHNKTFRVAELPKGIYILELAIADARLTKRVWIE